MGRARVWRISDESFKQVIKSEVNIGQLDFC